MKTMLIAVFASLLGAGTASAATAASQAERASYYYWLHPKLGMVKVDRATNAMVTARTARTASAQTDYRDTSRR